MPPTPSPEDLQFIDRAAHYLENPSFLIRLANLLGQPLEAFAKVVPDKVHDVAEKALKKAMELAIRTVPASNGNSNKCGMPDHRASPISLAAAPPVPVTTATDTPKLSAIRYSKALRAPPPIAMTTASAMRKLASPGW